MPMERQVQVVNVGVEARGQLRAAQQRGADNQRRIEELLKQLQVPAQPQNSL